MAQETKYQRLIALLDGVTANNSPPASNSAGIDLDELRDSNGKMPEFATVAIKGPGTGGTVSAVFRLWFLFPGMGSFWVPIDTGTDADKGKLNAASAVGEVISNVALHAQLVRIPSHANRAYLEVLSISGTGTAISAHLIVDK